MPTTCLFVETRKAAQRVRPATLSCEARHAHELNSSRVYALPRSRSSANVKSSRGNIHGLGNLVQTEDKYSESSEQESVKQSDQAELHNPAGGRMRR